jgi:hypothetical protein
MSRTATIAVYAISCAAMLVCAVLLHNKFAHSTSGCRDWGSIEIIGGCDSSGVCGVRYGDGRHGTYRYPVVGKNACSDPHKQIKGP